MPGSQANKLGGPFALTASGSGGPDLPELAGSYSRFQFSDPAGADPSRVRLHMAWREVDLNHRFPAYEAGEMAELLYPATGTLALRVLGKIRTCDLRLRRPALYPLRLRGQRT